MDRPDKNVGMENKDKDNEYMPPMNYIGEVDNKRVKLIVKEKPEEIPLNEIHSIEFRHARLAGRVKIILFFSVFFTCFFLICNYFTNDNEEMILLSSAPVLIFMTILAKYKGYYLLSVKKKDGIEMKKRIKYINRDDGMVFFKELKDNFKSQFFEKPELSPYKFVRKNTPKIIEKSIAGQKPLQIDKEIFVIDEINWN